MLLFGAYNFTILAGENVVKLSDLSELPELQDTEARYHGFPFT